MGKRKPAEDFSRAAPCECGQASGHRADRRAQMAYRARPIAITVMALRLNDRTVTHTDMAPSWISAVAMAPAVIAARKGMNMGLLSGLWWVGVGKEKRPGITPRAFVCGGMGDGKLISAVLPVLELLQQLLFLLLKLIFGNYPFLPEIL